MTSPRSQNILSFVCTNLSPVVRLGDWRSIKPTKIRAEIKFSFIHLTIKLYITQFIFSCAVEIKLRVLQERTDSLLSVIVMRKWADPMAAPNSEQSLKLILRAFPRSTEGEVKEEHGLEKPQPNILPDKWTARRH